MTAQPSFARGALVAAVFLTSLPVFAAQDDIAPEEFDRGYRVRVLLARPRAGEREVDRAEAAQRLRLLRAHPRLGGIRVLETDGQEDVTEVIKRLSATGLYDYVEPDYIRFRHAVPNDPRYAGEQWALSNTGQAGGTAGADIKAAAAWDIQRDAADVIVAVIDTGARLDHEDLNANLWRNTGEINGTPGVDNDGNGYINDSFGINATVAKTAAQAGDPNDENGHGSHVAGIIGAVGDNGKGVAGVAWKTKIMPLKFLTQRGGSVSASVACIDYAIAKGAHIINGSYGSLRYSQAEFDAIKRARDAGIIFVAAAGNDSQEISEIPEYPAAHQLDNIVAVASTTRQDKLASYSTFGSGIVELAAPGSSILSLGIADSQSYATLSGTSMAAPHVAGALALLRQKFPGDNYRALINRLLGAVDILPALEYRVHTNGRLNILRALNSTHTRPFNDDFARRAVITGAANIARGSNQFASVETAEPNHGVAGTTGTLWWSWTAPEGTGKVTLSTAGSGVDTVVAVYTGPANATLGALQRVAFNDDAAAGNTSSNLVFDATPGATYAIAVGAKDGGEGFVTLNVVSIPVNDMFAAARALAGPSVVVEGNNGKATSEPGEPKPRNNTGRTVGNDKTLWYKWVAPETRAYQISVSGKTTDPVTSVFTGAGLAGLEQIAFDDDSGRGLDSLVRLSAVAGGTYYICVDSYAATGSFTLSIADAAWQYVSEDEFYTSPALAPDGTIYAPDSFGYLHAVNPAGTRRWRVEVDGFISGGSVSVGADGTIYTADDFGDVYALNPANGARRWRYETGDMIWAAPAVGPDGTIYVKSIDDFLHAINPDGTPKWKVPMPGDTYSSPVVAADGTIYIGAGGDSALYALHADGTTKWRASLGATLYGSPALGADGTIYVGNYDGRFFALRPDGTERWRFDTSSPLSTSPVIDARGVVYVGSYDKKLYALDGATGAKRWEYATGDIIRSTAPVIADDGTIYVGSDDRFIHALDPDGRLVRTYATTGPILAAPLLAAGRLYVASSDGKLYAFDTGNNLARSPWPMHRQNIRRLGRSVDVAGIPTITSHPAAPTNARAGDTITIPALATVAGGGAVTYQWYFNDTAIPGGTTATLTIMSTQGSSAGSYRVVATGPGGSVVSRPTTLTVAAGATTSARLTNLAVRANAGGGDRVLFVGFSVGGASTSGNTTLLVRAAGPTLAGFGVSGAMADPRLQIYAGSALQLENDDWAGSAQVTSVGAQIGAFPFGAATSKDAAVVTTRPQGSYTAQISAPGNETGIALAEIYDATPDAAFTATTPRLVNVSARTEVGTGLNVLIVGFAIGGTSAKQILVRAIGPTLGSFGVTGVLANPKLELFANSVAISSNDDWGGATNAPQIAAAAASVGAFPLTLESRDAVLLLTLPPGSYTAQVSGVNNTSGAAIVEVYDVP